MIKVANVNGTVYVYGGQAKQRSDQTSDWWSKFIWLDTGPVLKYSRQRLPDSGSH
jgi:hypothetical protein